MFKLALIGKYGHGLYSQLSTEDYVEAQQWQWRLDRELGRKASYVTRGERVDGVFINRYLHVWVMVRALGRAIRPGHEVDRINGDTLDNRRENLREVTHSQNQMNRRVRYTSSSGLKGVSETAFGSLEVQIQFQKDKDYLAVFPKSEEGLELAARFYDVIAIQLFGEFARLNFPRSDYPDEL